MGEVVSVRRFVPAPPQEVFDLLADPRKHALIDGSGTLKASVSGPERLHQGARFGMAMRWGVPYRIMNTVVEFEEGRRIAWRHFGRHRWRYELEAVDGGTQVTESFDTSHVPAPIRPVPEYLGRHNRASIEKTLERLAAHFSD